MRKKLNHHTNPIDNPETSPFAPVPMKKTASIEETPAWLHRPGLLDADEVRTVDGMFSVDDENPGRDLRPSGPVPHPAEGAKTSRCR